ncbi:helix-turn-helix transcriptional regulator [uncultured Alistipes sp.]|jgi:transcriptional regulator, luxR family|uniref:helix-turn-helix transcriptional regulator n=1 Tax=uncultured Alistipes sp. TaxID=538949 RepID=UPI0025E9F5A7|nr:helix-turn-helix transcriptional regulator [uncultured Alistipes sp.]
MSYEKDFVETPRPGHPAHLELDYSIAERHIELLSRLAVVANSGISLFDTHLQKHIFTSYNFTDLFGYDMQRVADENTAYLDRHIHPDDIAVLERNGRAVLAYFALEENYSEIMQSKMINEYRLLVGERYVRVVEQYQVLEFDPAGGVWLTMSVLDMSPNQTPLNAAQSRLMNYVTGEVHQLAEFSEPGTDLPRLSQRERDILKLVSKGLYSKEISEQLLISVHTVNTHRQRILEKLNVDNSLEAVRYAAQHGLLD